MKISRVLRTAAVSLALTVGLGTGVAAAAPLPLEPAAPVADGSSTAITSSAATTIDGAAGSNGTSIPIPMSSGSSDTAATLAMLLSSLSGGAPCEPMLC